MPAKYPNVGMASSQGLSGNGRDLWHFSLSAMRESGRRYAGTMLSLSDPTFIPRRGESVAIFDKASRVA